MTSRAAMAGMPAESRSVRSLVACAVTIEAGLLLLHGDYARSSSAYLAAAAAAYLIAGAGFVWLIRQLHAGRISSSAGTLTVIVAAAAVFRLTLLPLSPGTSNDVNRYLWEGFVQAQGFSPYVHAPAALELSELAKERPELLSGVNHPTIASIYPPFAQLLFRSNELLSGGSVLGWKLILLGFDVLFGISAAFILRGRGISLVYLLVILWNPLLLMESYEAAHLDLIGISLLVVAIAAAGCGTGGLSEPGAPPVKGTQTRRLCHTAVAAVAVALSIQVKYLWPMLALILLVVEARRQRRALLFLATVGAVSLVCWAPYAGGFWSATDTARKFIEYWAFNGPLFEILRLASGPLWMPIALMLATLTILALLAAQRGRPDLLRDSSLLSATALLLGPVAYPWYFVWIVPLLLVERAAWVIIWPTLVALLHLCVGWNYRHTGIWETCGALSYILIGLPLFGLISMWRARLRTSAQIGVRASAGEMSALGVLGVRLRSRAPTPASRAP